jgi:hypothetical protein
VEQSMSENTNDSKRKVRRTALILLTVALAFYFGFIFFNVFRG